MRWDRDGNGKLDYQGVRLDVTVRIFGEDLDLIRFGKGYQR